MIGSFSTNPEVDEIILNKENLRPEYSQTEDTTIDDDFRLQCEERKETLCGTVVVCNSGCKCSGWKKVCNRCAKSAVQAG